MLQSTQPARRKEAAVDEPVAMQTPLTDLLRDLPRDAVFRWEHREANGWRSSNSAPIGRHCHAAADQIDALRAEVERLKAEIKIDEKRVADLMDDLDRVAKKKERLKAGNEFMGQRLIEMSELLKRWRAWSDKAVIVSAFGPNTNRVDFTDDMLDVLRLLNDDTDALRSALAALGEQKP